MRIKRTYHPLVTNGIRLLLLSLLLLSGMQAQAQIMIGGSVYGGGNEGKVGGNTAVTLRAGDIDKVFGGSRLADIDGRAFVNLDGEHASDYMLINYVYGGNDISGTIGKKTDTNAPVATVPTELTKTAENGIDRTWDAFVRISTKTTTTGEGENIQVVEAADAQKIYIGQLFAGGNGDYDYTGDLAGKALPTLKKTYLEILGGSAVYAFGGGNNATVTEKTVIHVENPSKVVNSIVVGGTELLNQDRINKMGYNPGYTYPTSDAFQIGSFFGGNNKAPMAIRPTWNLKSGKIRNLYSGGNEGDMTSTEGLLVEIPTTSTLVVDNLYGGCRKANVIPGGDLTSPAQVQNLSDVDENGNQKYFFPADFSARVLIRGGDVNNVYGGNDISGKVYGGNAIGVYATIRGDIYGSGNGSYPYTDNAALANDPTFGDLYYGTYADGEASVNALNAFRPNAEQVSIRVKGTSADQPTIIRGSIYLGGNSATLSTTKEQPKVELKIGSYVIADNVFLGNNGENMVKYHEGNPEQYVHEGVLRTYKRTLAELTTAKLTTEDYSRNSTKFSQIDLTSSTIFDKYMDGCVMPLMPSVVFDNTTNNDPATYIPYTTYIGSFYCGGNVGSMKVPNTTTINFNYPVIIYNKLVGGCNNANVDAVDGFNAVYEGGLLGTAPSGNKLELNLSGLKIQPKRWNNTNNALVWNTFDEDGNEVDAPTALPAGGTSTDADKERRLRGGNIYGGCYNSGHVNGNVIINLNASIVDLKGQYAVFDSVKVDNEGEALLYGNDSYTIIKRRSGVILDEQGMDVLGKSLNVFGGGYGPESEIWGSTTINLNNGFTFQIFGGGEQGAIGKPDDPEGDDALSYTFTYKKGDVTKTRTYRYNSKYSCTINLNGHYAGVYRGHADDNADMAEAEFIYGGGFLGTIAGNTRINLGNGRIFNSFAGSCNADILGHTETYVGLNTSDDTKTGFPYIRDHIYGGNDLGGRIWGEKDFSARVNTASKNLVYNPKTKEVPDVLKASAYTEYIQGRVVNIFGGCYGVYDYKLPHFKDYAYTIGETDTNDSNIGTARPGFTKPRLGNAFINFKPAVHARSSVNRIYGAGQGYSLDSDRDIMQTRSYILIDAPQEMTRFQDMQVFGAGESCGLGMDVSVDDAKNNTSGVEAAAVIDLVHGQIAAAYGASYNEGITRRTIVNVPKSSATSYSTIAIGSIFGGGFGNNRYLPCDAYEAHVNYNSEKAYLIYDTIKVANKGAIYGGNNNQRRTLYGQVNVTVPLRQQHIKYGMTTGTVYGAGCGGDTWSEYTEVNLLNGAEVYEVYGGGQQGKVYNTESVTNFMHETNKPATWPAGTEKAGQSFTSVDWANAWDLGNYNPVEGKAYWEDSKTNLANALVRVAEMDDRDFSGLTDADKAMVQNRYTANVIINEGAKVENYAYGGGYGKEAVVSGTTYIALLGGEVNKDIYAAGTSGSVEDIHGAGVYSSENPEGFVASANVYVKGGTVRNVYGGGWRGSVGHHGNHTGVISDVANNPNDRDGEVHVVIGDLNGTSHTNGIPSITRNVYGGGEGGAIFGDAYVKINKGYIGYRYNAEGTDNNQTTDFDEHYVPELDDVEAGDNLLDNGGNVFGGGYVANSYVDRSRVIMKGGIVRGSLYGGGEIGPIGRGTVHADSIAKYPASKMNGAAIYKGGMTRVELWDGHVMRDVFGGGRGYDNWNGEGYMTAEEKKTMDRSSKGYVFGSTDVHIYGGEVGTETNVLRGYGNVFGGGNEGFVYSATGTKSADGYYRDSNSKLSEDCKIAVEPRCKVTADGGITIGTKTYAKGEYVEVEELNKLKSRTHTADWAKLDTRGIVIHNALFAGGNITEGSDKIFANTVTVYGNAAASLRDVYNFDLISLGTEEMGGLYGDGNLTLVDGFRELHIDNYGTDYYSLEKTMLLSEYEQLTARQQAYYKLKYGANDDHSYKYYESRMLHTYNGVSYRKGEKIPRDSGNDIYDTFDTEEKKNWTQGSRSYKKDEQIEEGEYSLMDGTDSEIAANKTGEKKHWTLIGVTSIYAGRPMNTIQRADFCGVFGSRMVMKGAVDRAPQANGNVDYNSYTINRVEEVSLNKRESQAGDTSAEDKEHGNYFGIYNSVKFLGNLTSDVAFTDVRKTDTENTSIQADGKTYYAWKSAKPQSKYRNNGISHNMVALASGVYLELKKEESETAGKDVWGHITGVVELDLINVMPGMGGGYVYAKNEHGTPTKVDNVNKVSLLSFNTNASTYRQFTYSSPTATDDLQAIETSGNFVHNTKQIVDDCYPNGGIYNDQYVASPAHYWFIRGSIYVYEQYISAFTGAANATAEKQEIPLNITAASNGRLILRDVQPNFYAYYDKGGNKLGTENADTVFVVNNVAYKLNQAISNWDYNLLSEGDKAKFVDKTYLVVEDCKIGTTEYKKGTLMLYDEYDRLKKSNPTIKYMEGEEEKSDGNFDYFFRLSNNLGHDTGYILTYDVNNPMVWNNYYTKTASPGQANALNTKQYESGKDKDGNTIAKSDYTEGPTYTLKSGVTSTVFGQQDYTLGSIVYGSAKSAYDAGVYSHLSETAKEKQAQVEQAYVVTKEHSVKNTAGEEVQKLTVGTPIYKSKFTDAQWSAITSAGAAEVAKVCTSLLEFSSTDYVWAGKVLSSADIAEIKTKIKAKNTGWTDAQVETYLNSYLDNAFYCTKAGKYGGIYFEPGKAYRALDTWCSMPKDERENFTFNYDALDLLIDKDFGGEYGSKTQYDGTNEDKVYSSVKPVDYQAEFVGYEVGEGHKVETITYLPKSGGSVTINKSTSKDDWKSREEYEAIPNEKRHYSPIIITEPGTYYMVRNTFMDGEVPYTTGQQIDEETFNALGSIKQANIDKFKFVAPTGTNADNNKAVTNPKTTDSEGHLVYEPKTYYYCRDGYTINEKGEGKPVTTVAVTKNGDGVSSVEYKVAENYDVPQGVLIAAGSSSNDEGTYSSLCNFQKGFVIHGTSPTEVSTLYVSNESDINDLSAEKIITVIYLYEYDESDESGLNVTPVSERHILNIHINFKSGVPEIGDINKPDIVLPGTTLGVNIPSVTQGAFRVTESGWEIFSNGDDAATHYNGTPFYNNETPLYWYQNNYWLAYYAQTSLGKTYSKSVQLSVANYHDLKKVMDDKEHHYYIDHKDVERQPKIYINDYSDSDENGLDLFKDLIDLSYVTRTYDANGNPVPVSSGKLAGHVPFESHAAKPMKGGQYLEFFLKNDLSYPDTEEAADEWTPIANGTNECFSGNFHGEGHTISGLDNSLFSQLCGSVYNLGVTGSFTGAGIAETGGGYVENCWISTSSTAAKTSKPVFDNPTDLSSDRPYRIVNCYYQEDGNAANKYHNHPAESTYGIPTRKDSKAFYNGEVAYDLNGFYLYKRYSDQKVASKNDYQCYYVTTNTDGEQELELQTKHYGDYNSTTAPLCSFGYVEKRYEDGDFRYAEGSIPSSEDKRAYTVTDTNGTEATRFAPIWPDDYLFFGQSLTYDYSGGHQSQPSAINKASGRLATDNGSNRVYRAPAYYGSKTMGVAHFNPAAILAAYSKPPTETSTNVKEAYPGMTAIDFAGHGDTEYRLGVNGSFFYQPLLDDGGLYSIENADETHNLLVYAPTEAANKATYGVLNRYFTEPTYATIDTYGSVGIASSTVLGHVVQNDLKTTNDHLLVDKQDFNCPISYTMGTGKRMWYQRTPDKFVTLDESGSTKGWENISLPFEVSHVATQQKGEITHFYNYKNNETREDNTIGHEYWLRMFAGNLQPKKANGVDVPGVFTADFNLLDPSGANKTYSNTFLWDYYYKQNPNGNEYGDDKNGEDYKRYYNTSHTYTRYPLEQAGGAYLIGFPGKSYYEFDLSGEWTAANTASPAPGKLDKQTITFASGTGVNIKVSDGEITAGKTVVDGYAYVPNYMNKKFTTEGESYVMAENGASYVKNAANATVSAFRPYIVKAANSPTRGKESENVEQVEFENDDTRFLLHDDIVDRLDGTLNIYVKKGKTVVVESSLRYTVDVSIYTPAGVVLYKFPVKAGETVEQRVNSNGVYIVHSDDDQHVKKVIVR